MNIIIGNKTSIITAATECSNSLRQRAMTDIPSKTYSQKTKAGHCTAAMAKAWSLLYELLQASTWKRELAVFVTILEGAQMYCLDKLDSEKNSKEKVCKTVMLSSDKLDREYGWREGDCFETSEVQPFTLR